MADKDRLGEGGVGQLPPMHTLSDGRPAICKGTRWQNERFLVESVLPPPPPTSNCKPVADGGTPIMPDGPTRNCTAPGITRLPSTRQPWTERRGRRVAGVELRHLTGQPGGGGD